MEFTPKSIRPFIGATNFIVSCNFYKDFGFTEVALSPKMSLFHKDEFGFYLQDAFVKDWIDNTMIFMEVQDVEGFWNELITLNLTIKYKEIKLAPVRNLDWGKECFVHDPSGVLWHIGEFNNK